MLPCHSKYPKYGSTGTNVHFWHLAGIGPYANQLFFLLSFAGLPPTFSFSQSFSCCIFQICGHAGGKENHFYSLPFGKAEASIY